MDKSNQDNQEASTSSGAIPKRRDRSDRVEFRIERTPSRERSLVAALTRDLQLRADEGTSTRSNRLDRETSIQSLKVRRLRDEERYRQELVVTFELREKVIKQELDIRRVTRFPQIIYRYISSRYPNQTDLTEIEFIAIVRHILVKAFLIIRHPDMDLPAEYQRGIRQVTVPKVICQVIDTFRPFVLRRVAVYIELHKYNKIYEDTRVTNRMLVRWNKLFRVVSQGMECYGVPGDFIEFRKTVMMYILPLHKYIEDEGMCNVHFDSVAQTMVARYYDMNRQPIAEPVVNARQTLVFMYHIRKSTTDDKMSDESYREEWARTEPTQ